MFYPRQAVKVLSVSADGLTTTYIKNNKQYTVTKGDPAGFYPGGSRAAAYKGGIDRRHTRETVEMVHEERQRTGRMFRHVKPGPQSW